MILSNDEYFSKRKKIIFSATKDLFYNLNKKKIKSQIIIAIMVVKKSDKFDKLYKKNIIMCHSSM